MVQTAQIKLEYIMTLHANLDPPQAIDSGSRSLSGLHLVVGDFVEARRGSRAFTAALNDLCRATDVSLGQSLTS